MTTVVHILDGNLPTHYNKIIKYMRSLDEKAKFILIGGDKKNLDNSLRNSVEFMSLTGLFVFYIKASRNRCFVVHGNFFKFILFHSVLALISLKSSSNFLWVCWGAGINTDLKNLWVRKMRRFSYQRIGAVNFLMEPDKAKFFKIVGDKSKVRTYVTPYFNEQVGRAGPLSTRFKDNYLHVFLGNQSSRHHNHELMIEKILESDNKNNVFLHLIMSYGTGDDCYVNYIEGLCESKLPKRYRIYRKVLDYNSYLELLSIADVVVLDTKHQTGLGLIYNAINNGATVFLNQYGSNYKWLRELGLSINGTNEISYEKMNDKSSLDINKSRLVSFFDGEKVENEWKLFIFNIS